MFKTLAIPNIFSQPPRQAQHATPAQLVRRKTAPRQAAVSPASPLLSYGLLAAGGVLFLWYMLGVNASASKGFEMKQIQTRISKLSEENKKMNVSLSEKYSIAGIQQDFEKDNFVPAGQVQYIQTESLSQR